MRRENPNAPDSLKVQRAPRKTTMKQCPYMTTAAGTPVVDNQNSETAGPRGPVLMQDYQLMEKMAHFNRERVPERVVHAKGAGAFGTLTVTGDLSRYTCAKLFSKAGNSCEMFGRFSTVAGEMGSADTVRDPRGFALKFYTEEGNWDLVGNNTPVFFVRDPLKFSDFIHSQKRDPATGLRDNTMQWDYWSLSPRVAASGHHAVLRPGHSRHVAPYERLFQPHL